VDRHEAQRFLGVSDDADLVTLKRRFRVLARELHPDHGGDPAAFRDVHRAFALLRDDLPVEDGAPRAPRVGRGRPSRTEDTGDVRRAMDELLDAEALALAGRLDADRGLRLTSRAPGARGNRLATSLDAAATSSLHVVVGPAARDDDPASCRIELTARPRASRRAVTALDLRRLRVAAWTRSRGDAITVLHAALRVRTGDVTSIELLAAGAVSELLGALAWPLEQWTSEPAGR